MFQKEVMTVILLGFNKRKGMLEAKGKEAACIRTFRWQILCWARGQSRTHPLRKVSARRRSFLPFSEAHPLFAPSTRVPFSLPVDLRPPATTHSHIQLRSLGACLGPKSKAAC